MLLPLGRLDILDALHIALHHVETLSKLIVLDAQFAELQSRFLQVGFELSFQFRLMSEILFLVNSLLLELLNFVSLRGLVLLIFLFQIN